MDLTRKPVSKNYNAPIASLQEAYQSISREVAPAAVVGNWALRLSLFDNASWDTSSIEIALAHKPKPGSLKSLMRQGYKQEECEEREDGSERRVVLKPENGYSIPVTMVYDKSGSAYMYGIPTSAMFYNSIDMEVPKVRIASKKVMLSYELLAARSARTESDSRTANEHTYAAYRLLEGLYNLNISDFIVDLVNVSRSAQRVLYNLSSLGSTKQPERAKASWPDSSSIAIIAEEALKLHSMIRGS